MMFFELGTFFQLPRVVAVRLNRYQLDAGQRVDGDHEPLARGPTKAPVGH